MADDPYGKALLAAQVTAITAGLWPAPRRWPLPPPVTAGAALLALGGGAIGLAGLAALGGRFRPGPAPAPDAVLRTEGMYGRVRHPMYTSLLTAGSGIAVLRARPEPFGALVALGVALGLKIKHEERLLRDRFGEAYDSYADEVPALVPRLTRAARETSA